MHIKNLPTTPHLIIIKDTNTVDAACKSERGILCDSRRSATEGTNSETVGVSLTNRLGW